jgi:hypothetical protein
MTQCTFSCSWVEAGIRSFPRAGDGDGDSYEDEDGDGDTQSGVKYKDACNEKISSTLP